MSSTDLINDLLKLLADKINNIKQNDYKINEYENKIIKTEDTIKELVEYPVTVGSIDLSYFVELIRGAIPADDSTYSQDRLSNILKGLELPRNAIPYLHTAEDFEEDELEKINDFVELLKYTLTVLNRNKNLEVQKQESNPELLIYTRLYDMIRFAENGVERFEEPEIRALLDLIKDRSYEYKLDVLERINEYNNRIQINKLKVEDEEDVVAANSFDFDAFNQLLMNNGFPSFMQYKTYNSFAIYYKGFKLNNINAIITYLLTEPNKYAFLLKPSIPLKDSYVKKLFGVFRYSNVNILKSLAAQDMLGASVEDIFNISGVYRPVPKHSNSKDSTPRPPVDNYSTDETGTYDYYINNKRYLDNLSVQFNAVRAQKGLPPEDLYLKIFTINKDVLKTPHELFKANFELLMKYDLITPETDKFSVSGIHMTNLREQIDRLIECGLYDTIKKYLSTVTYSSIYVDLLTYHHQIGDLGHYINADLSIRELREESNGIGFGTPRHIKLQSDIINNKLDTFMNNINRNIISSLGNSDAFANMSTAIVDPILANLISTFELKDNSDKAKHMLVVNGVIISKDKFINNWNIISNTLAPITYEEKVLLAATYGSRYSETEIDRLLDGFSIEPKILEPQRGV